MKFDNPYDEACYQLQLNSIPNYFPCREKEQDQITSYLREGIANCGQSSSLYISGMPGTGKTATTLHIISKLRKSKSIKEFDFIHINAMQLTNPNLVYTILAEKITGRRMNPQSSAHFLDEFFKKSEKKQTIISHTTKGNSRHNKEALKKAMMTRVVLIDELDALVTTKQTLLYNLFDWPCHKNSNLLLISIANTMDLPEKLQKKITSRIGNERLVYEPYSQQQIKKILESRLTGLEIFGDRSLDLVSKKVSQYSGDIRRSLQIMKRSVEICREQNPLPEDFEYDKSMKLPRVCIDHVVSAFDEMSNSKSVKVLGSLRKMEVLVIIALYLELRNRKSDKVLIEHVQDRCDMILNQIKNRQKKLGEITRERQ